MSVRFPSALLAAFLAPSLIAAQSAPAEPPLGVEARRALTGVYAIVAEPGAQPTPLRVFGREDTLMGQLGGGDPTPLIGAGANVFRPAAAPEFTITFVVHGGTADSVYIRSPQGNMAGARSDGASLDPSRSGALFDALAHMDSVLFDATYVTCDTARIDALLSDDVEFYHDRTGFHGGDQVRDDFQRMADACPRDQGVTRALVPETLRVYPIADFGAIQTGTHRFVEEGTGRVTEARFVHLWRRTDGGWRIHRVLSFDHHAAGP